MCSPPSIGSTSSNYTLDCVVTAPGLEPQAVQHKGMAPVDKWPRLGVDLPTVVDRRHPSRFIIKWDRIDKDPLEDWIAGGQQRAQLLAAQMRSGAAVPQAPSPAAHLGEIMSGAGGAQLSGAGLWSTSAADVLANGIPVRVEIVQTTLLPVKNPEGLDMYAFKLTVLHDGQPSTEARVGNPVPAGCVHLLYPGSNLPARMLADDPSAVVIDWQAALRDS